MTYRITQLATLFRRTCWRTSTVISLALLLSLGVVEPLLCLVHCEIMALRMESAHAHMAAVMPGMDSMAMGGMAMPGMHHDDHTNHMASQDQPPGAATTCTMNHGAPATDGVQPQPFHEMALLGTLLLLGVAILWRRVLPLLPAPAQHFTRPPLRPPTSSTSFFTA